MTVTKLNLQKGRSYNQSQKELNKSTSDLFNQHNLNVTRLGLKQLQQRLSITETTADVVNASTTSISINTTGFDIIKNKDRLVIVNPVTGVATNISPTADVKGTDTTMSISSAIIYAPSGSFIMFSDDFLNYFIRGGTITVKTIISNANYKILNTSPTTLVSGVTGQVMIPVNLLIITSGYVNDDEGNNRTLYCGHGTTTGTGTYWDSIRSFNYRERSNSSWNMTGDTGKIFGSSVSGQPIKLYSDGSFESDDFSLTVYLTYRIDSE